MPLRTRILIVMTVMAGALAAQGAQSMARVGDNGNWAAVGAILTGVSYACMKLFDRMSRR